MEESKSTKLNFRYFIKMALQKKISWETLLVFLDDLTPTHPKSKQAIEVLVEELQALQSKLHDNEDDGGIIEIVEILNTNTSNANGQKTQLSAVDSTKKDGNIVHSEIKQLEVVSENVEARFVSKDTVMIDNAEKVFAEPEIIQIDYDEVPIQSNHAERFKTKDLLTKDSKEETTMFFQINGENAENFSTKALVVK